MAAGLLRRQVLHRPQHRPGLRDRRRREGAGDAEVGDLHLAVPGEEDVLGFDVPVHDLAVVGVGQHLADLGSDLPGARLGERAHPPQQRLEVLPLDELHHDEVDVFVAPGVVELDHAWMGQPGHGLGLALEAGHEIFVVRILLPQHLDRDLAVVGQAAAAIDQGHPALAEVARDLVFAGEDPADHG